MQAMYSKEKRTMIRGFKEEERSVLVSVTLMKGTVQGSENCEKTLSNLY